MDYLTAYDVLTNTSLVLKIQQTYYGVNQMVWTSVTQKKKRQMDMKTPADFFLATPLSNEIGFFPMKPRQLFLPLNRLLVL